MTTRHLLAALAASAAALAALAPAAAHAAAKVSPSEVIDGPTADILAVGGVDLARDGTGTVVYVKRDGGIPHVFAADLVAGVWGPPQRVDAGLATAASNPVVSVTAAGRTAIAYLSEGTVYAQMRKEGSSRFSTNGFTPPQPLAPGGAPSLDMGVNGTAFVVFPSAGDVRAAYLDRAGTQFTLVDGALDAVTAQPAGDIPARRPRVSASADGTGLVVWGEQAPDGSQHVYSRRLLRGVQSPVLRDLNMPTLAGHAGGAADLPDVRQEDDSSFAWVVFRQAFDGVPRAVARRLIGTDYDPPALIDGQGFPAADGANAPDVAVNGTGGGLAAVSRTASHQVFAAPIFSDSFDAGAGRMDSAPVNILDPAPLTAVSQIGDGYVAWQQATSPTDIATLRGRLFERGGFKGEAVLTKPALGPIDPAAGFEISSDRLADVAAVAVQAGADGRRLVAGMVDQGPRAFSGITRVLPRGERRLRWKGPLELWGPLRYTVLVDGKVAGRTQDRTSLLVRRRPKAGNHRWQVVAVDRRGTRRASHARRLIVEQSASKTKK